MYDCHSFGFTSRALPWISSDGPLFEKSGPLLGLRRNVRDLPTVEDVHFAFIDIMRSSVHQPIDAAEKL